MERGENTHSKTQGCPFGHTIHPRLHHVQHDVDVVSIDPQTLLKDVGGHDVASIGDYPQHSLT